MNASRLPPLAVVAGQRTPFVKAFGPLAGVTADRLGCFALEAALASAGVGPAAMDEVVFGNVAGPPEASNVARVIALRSGIPADRIVALGEAALFSVSYQGIAEDEALPLALKFDWKAIQTAAAQK